MGLYAGNEGYDIFSQYDEDRKGGKSEEKEEDNPHTV